MKFSTPSPPLLIWRLAAESSVLEPELNDWPMNVLPLFFEPMVVAPVVLTS